jgi:subtilisin family serine protease
LDRDRRVTGRRPRSRTRKTDDPQEGKIDPQLEFLREGGLSQLATTGDTEAVYERFGVESADARAAAKEKKPPPTSVGVTVLVRYAGDTEALEKAGLEIHSVAGDVVTGRIALSAVAELAALPEVEQVEAARAMQPELDLAIVESRANLVHTGPPGRRGAGVIVGICDTGCDFTHQSFRRPDGTSRILFLWDQGLARRAGENAPAGFGYGVEYTNAQINAALAAANPFNAVRHRDRGGHGTHVTGIAAGDGSAPGQGRPGGTFVGVAPEADIIVVANATNGAEGLGTSASTLDAVNYMFQRAGDLSRPCVVNMSLGDNLGPHDGTSLLERGLDNLLGGPGRAFVKSAGNAAAARIHAEGNVVSGGTQDVRFNQPAGDAGANQIDLWYRGGDTFRVSVIDPAGNTVGPVNVGTATTFNLPGGNTVRIDHRNADPFNGDRRVFMIFAPGAMGTMRAGNWTIRLAGVASPTGGRFDAWIQRGAVVPQFLPPHESPARTISTPGTAREVITAANYVTRGAGVGSLANSSSRGPTRDGRAAPTIAAPGMLIISADGESSSGDPYRPAGGTSMAAPHVAGTIALMFQKKGNQTQSDIRACLESSARRDAQTGPVPNTAWGAGKLDANAAVDCVPSAWPTRSVVVICPEPVSVLRCPPSTMALCPSVPRAACLEPSALTLCPSVPIGSCGIASIATSCPSRFACPSVVDACPSTPAGCTFQSLACGVQSVACGVGWQPFGARAMPSEGEAARAGEPEPLPEGWAMPEEEAAQPEVPEEGYFEYDESWFDEDEQPAG